MLDVDNGAGFLVHDRNTAVYEVPTLRRAAAALRPDGLLVVWSSAPAPALHDALADTIGSTDHVVRRVAASAAYHLYVATRGGGTLPRCT